MLRAWPMLLVASRKSGHHEGEAPAEVGNAPPYGPRHQACHIRLMAREVSAEPANLASTELTDLRYWFEVMENATSRPGVILDLGSQTSVSLRASNLASALGQRLG